MAELNIDPEFHALIPPLTEEEYNALADSIAKEGCRDALVVWNDIIIDGHNRYEICNKLNISFATTTMNFDSREDAKIWIIQNQFSRRNLSAWNRSKLVLNLKPLLAAKAKTNQLAGLKQYQDDTVDQKSDKRNESVNTNKELAKVAGVSTDTISKSDKIQKKATPEQKERLDKEEASINQVYQQIRSKEKRNEKVEELKQVSENIAESLEALRQYPVIYADPPWRYEHSKSDSRKIENQYPTMSLDDICNLPVNNISSDDCILFLWATSPKLAEAMKVIEAWNFNYRTCMVWVKDKIGLGYYARQRHELLLIATKGNIPTPLPENRPDSVIEAAREEHSKKPDIVYHIIERMYPELPKLELFARQKRDNWKSWGNQCA